MTAFYDGVVATESDEACSQLTEEALQDPDFLTDMLGVSYSAPTCEEAVDGIIPTDRDNIATYEITSTQEGDEDGTMVVDVEFEVGAARAILEESDGGWLISYGGVN